MIAKYVFETRLYGCEKCAAFMLHALAQVNKMQQETADFVPGAASWPTGRNIPVRVVLSLILAYLAHYVKT